MKTEVTVIIVAYNQEAYVRETIESILKQKTSFPISIYISDDCSTDNSENIYIEYQNKYPEIIEYNRRKNNVGAVRNIFYSFFENKESRYIALCAGDDVWVDEYKLQKQYDVIDKQRDLSVVFTGYRKVYEGTDKVENITRWESPLLYRYGRKALKYVYLENFTSFPVASSMMFRTSILNMIEQYKSLYEDSNAPGEAMILFPSFTISGKYWFLPDVTTAYRIRTGSLSHQKSLNKKKAFSIKYAIQKIKSSQLFGASRGLVDKLTIKLIFLYLYSVKDEEDLVFMEEFNKIIENEANRDVCRAKNVISLINKNSLMKALVMSIFKIIR